MLKLLRFRLLALATCCLVFPAAAYADPLVIKNELDDNETSFVWMISFKGLPALNSQFLIQALYKNLPIEWGGIDKGTPMTMFVDNTNGIFFVDVDGRHLDGPHNSPGNFDIDPGEHFNLRVNLNMLSVDNMRLDSDVVTHLHSPGDHSDVVELFGRRSVDGEFTFIITGTHQSVPAPEPATLLLFATGLAGVTIKTRKRLKSRKAGQGSQ